MIFSNPIFLSLLIFIPFFIWHQIRKDKDRFVIPFSSINNFKGYKSRLARYRWMLDYIWIIVLALLTIAFARPQMLLKAEGLSKEGIEIVLAIDVSGSMREEGERTEKLKTVKTIAKEFIKGRKNDRIGLVAFAGSALMICPLTDDYNVLSNFIDSLKFGILPDGTALGDAVAVATDMLRQSNTRGKPVLKRLNSGIVMLLSDGINNSGSVDPVTSAKVARIMGVRVYTIEEGSAVEHYLIQRQTNIGMDIDLLKEVADISGGSHFKIPDTKNLLSVYKEVEKIEKDRLKSTKTDYTDVYQYFLITALAIFLGEVVFLNTRLRKIP